MSNISNNTLSKELTIYIETVLKNGPNDVIEEIKHINGRKVFTNTYWRNALEHNLFPDYILIYKLINLYTSTSIFHSVGSIWEYGEELYKDNLIAKHGDFVGFLLLGDTSLHDPSTFLSTCRIMTKGIIKSRNRFQALMEE